MGLERSRAHRIKKAVADRLPESIVEKWETSTRKRVVDREGWVEANAALAYEIKGDYIALHVPEMLKDRKPEEMLEMFREGLREIARSLKEPERRSIQYIESWSWLAYRYPRIATRRLGFEILQRDERTEQSLARMNRDVLIRRYGQIDS